MRVTDNRLQRVHSIAPRTERQPLAGVRRLTVESDRNQCNSVTGIEVQRVRPFSPKGRRPWNSKQSVNSGPSSAVN
jgi:hypothetical protein